MTGEDCLWLGLDLGTQGARAVLVDAKGAVVGRGAHPLPSHRDGNRHEQDPEDWWTAAAAACREALDGNAADRVVGMAVDATSGTVLLATADGTPASPGLMYDDSRATAEAAEVNSAGEHVWARLGYQSMQPSWALPKVLWLLHHHGELSGARILHQADLVTSRLVGRAVATDWSHALKTGYDVVDADWPVDVIEALGIDPAVLPDVVAPGSVLGEVGARAAAETGIPAGTPVIAGMTDGCAAQLATGATNVGSWNSVLGTTMVLKGVSDHLVVDRAGVVYCHRGPSGQWFPGGASSSGAGVIAYSFAGQDLDRLTAEAAHRGPRAVAYPLLSAGERFPFRSVDARPIVLGSPTDDVDLFSAYLVGLACVERLCFDYVESIGAPTQGRISFTGGGSRNAYWSQLRADLLGRSVDLPANSDAAYGMALHAVASVEGPEAAAGMVAVTHTLEPDDARAAPLRAHFIDLIDELAHLGWLDSALAERARRKAAQ